VNPGGGSGWDEPPLEIQIPDDARELERDVIAYHRELRARRRQRRLRKLTGPFAGQGTVMPLLASILAVCLVAGAMLSVATFSPSTAPENPSHHPSATAASGLRSATQRSSPANSAPASTSGASASGASTSGASPSGVSPSGVSPSGRGGTARPSGSANSSARSTPPASQFRPARPGGP
jgi:cytoskeletal protein RodZ